MSLSSKRLFCRVGRQASRFTRLPALSVDRRYSNCAALTSSLQSGLNDDQLAFQELALQFMNERLKPNGLKWDEEHACDYNVIKEAGGLGFGGIYCDPEFGGTGLNRLDATIIFESLAQGCVSTTALLTIHNMTAWMLDKYGSSDLKNEFLSQMTQCELMGSYCLTEPHSGSDAAALKTTLTLDESNNNEYIVNGSKMFISGGGKSDLYFVMTRLNDKNQKFDYNKRSNDITCVVIPKDSKGVIFGKNESKMGWNGSPTCTVTFDNVRIPSKYIVGEIGQGFKIALSGLDGGRLNIGACSLGAAHRCLNDAIAYSSEREQFNMKIKDMQHNSFKMADLLTDLHSCRLLLRDAATKMDENDKNKTMYCAMAKKYVTDVGFNICNQSLQFLGGYGYLKEYEIERFVRDSRVHQILEGTNEIMRLIIARNIFS